MFWMEETPASVPAVHIHAPTKHLLYLCRPDTRWLRTILAHYTADKAEGDLQHVYTVAFVPHRTEPCVQFLCTHQCLDSIQIFDLGLEFSVLSQDVLSLEDPFAWPRIFLQGDHTSLFHAAQALVTLQRMWGLFRASLEREIGQIDCVTCLSDSVRKRLSRMKIQPRSKRQHQI